jgi:glycosyltransferase involved in cell wall biosynthesis
MNARHRLMDRLALRRADAVVANAPAVRDDVIRRVGLDPSRVQVIMNGVDTVVFRPGDSALRETWRSMSGGTSLIGFVGSLRDAKDPALFLTMAARVAAADPGAAFLVVGDGPLRARLESMARENGLSRRVIFAGERTDIPEVLRALDLLAVTSVREGCCNVILEAMATGVPVVATAVGGNPDLVEHGRNGLLFAHGDAESGARAVLSLLPGGEPAGRLAEAGLRRARADFSVAAMVGATSALYESLA